MQPLDSATTALARGQLEFPHSFRTQLTCWPDSSNGCKNGFPSGYQITIGVSLIETRLCEIPNGEGRGIDTENACWSQRIRRRLRCFRAGAEGLISWLKRSLQMRESRWKGAEGFDAYVWAVIVTACSAQAITRSG